MGGLVPTTAIERVSGSSLQKNIWRKNEFWMDDRKERQTSAEKNVEKATCESF
jgi:hypothetical protein